MCKLTPEKLNHAPELKLKRAEHHINDLSRRMDAFLAERPFKLMLHGRPTAKQVALRSKTEKSIPPEFSLIIGDIAHNLRSALDVTLYPMAKDRAKKPDRIQFPFPKDATPEAFRNAAKEGQVKFAGEKVLEQVRQLKTYPTGNAVLYGIHALNICDKHRLLVLTRNIPNIITGTNVQADQMLKLFLQTNLIKPGAKFVLAAPDSEDLFSANANFEGFGDRDFEKETEFQPAFTIAFSEGQPFEKREVVETLVSCTKEVRRAVDELIAAYLDPANTFPS
jgi:hypothetical protein